MARLLESVAEKRTDVARVIFMLVGSHIAHPGDFKLHLPLCI